MKTSLTRKRWSKYVFMCMMPKPKDYLSNKYKKFHDIAYQKKKKKKICIDQKV